MCVTGGLDNEEVRRREFRDLTRICPRESHYSLTVECGYCLEAENFPPILFDYAYIRDIISEQYKERRSHEHLLSLLISFGLAIKYFLYDEFDDVPASLCAA